MPAVNPHQILDPQDVDWSRLWEKFVAYSSHFLHVLTVANDWTVDHPYVTIGILLCICIKPGIILRPIWLIWKTVSFTCLLIWRLITWPFKALSRLIGFTRHGVEGDSFAGNNQSCHHGGPNSSFAHLQSYGATYEGAGTAGCVLPDPGNDYCFAPGSKPVVAVSWVSSIGAMFVLCREWGPEKFFLSCAMVLLVMFGALILISKTVTFVPPATAENHEAPRSSTA